MSIEAQFTIAKKLKQFKLMNGFTNRDTVDSHDGILLNPPKQ